MENTLENKAKFFAQYWGQKVFFTGVNQENPHKNSFGRLINKNDFLLLKPISSITDEEIKEIEKMIAQKFQRAELVYSIYNHSFFTAEILISYLRSKGYALPYMGLSVEKLIEYGWVKLKGN